MDAYALEAQEKMNNRQQNEGTWHETPPDAPCGTRCRYMMLQLQVHDVAIAST